MNNTLSDQLSAIKAEAVKLLPQIKSGEELKLCKAKFLGKNGVLTGILKGLGQMPAEIRPLAGKEINELKKELEDMISTAEAKLNAGKIERALQEQVDVTLPGQSPFLGNLHPVTQIISQIEDIFAGLGFSIYEGREIETDYYNFEALNHPPDHPARDMQDTFYINPKQEAGSKKQEDFLLRTHTSPVQIHVMEKFKPPIRMIFPGAVYRRDADLSHSPMFHQVEGLMVDEKGKITMASLKWALTEFIHRMFGEKLDVRFRPSFFPFTEPSAEVDMECFNGPCRVCKGTGWMEILGCGMVDPNVFTAVGYDPKKVAGFAFGMGVERVAMLKLGISDIRMFFENDVRFLKQF